MNEKVENVIAAMINSPFEIADIYRAGNEFYFRFRGHVFSIVQRSPPSATYGRTSFYVYPKWTGDFSKLASAFDHDPEAVPMMAYHDPELSKRGKDSLTSLYSLLEERHLGIDEVFNDVLGFPES